MSVQIAASGSEFVVQPAKRASFPGMMRGEWLKIARLFWIMLALLAIGMALAFWLGSNPPGIKADLQQTPLHYLYYSLESNLVIERILGGIFLLVLTSFVVGREYQYGTIRILLARGTGRVQLLLAKLALLALIALALQFIFTLLIALLTCFSMLMLAGNLNGLNALTSSFWLNIGIDQCAVSISMGSTILMAVAMNALTRSLTLGLSLSLIWFPFDNIATLLMNALERVTQSHFWATATTYLLGPLLNRLPGMLLPAEARTGFESFGSGASDPTTGSHALWVIGAYSLIFLVLALISTWKRDVKE
jgi:ABC-2 type transport system permease protein